MRNPTSSEPPVKLGQGDYEEGFWPGSTESGPEEPLSGRFMIGTFIAIVGVTFGALFIPKLVVAALLGIVVTLFLTGR